MPAPIPIGRDNFTEHRELGLEYVDKTHLIRLLLDDVGTIVTLLPRPRRFGKTLNMTMLRAFFGRSDNDLSHLFEGLHIWAAGEPYLEHFQRYPVIFLTFKDDKPDSRQSWDQTVSLRLAGLFGGYRVLLEGAGVLSDAEQEQLEALCWRKADEASKKESLFLLTEWLERVHGEKVLILIDEYDAPVHAAWVADTIRREQMKREGREVPDLEHDLDSCYRAVTDFFRAFFGKALKSNDHLFKAVLTGILRVSKESIFSDLNNPRVSTILDPEYSDCFGFTETEVKALFERQGQSHRLEEARRWYNGYLFGQEVIYNPWSVLYFLSRPTERARAYWLNTSSNDLIRELLWKQAFKLHETLQELLEGRPAIARIEENFVFPQLESQPAAALSLMLFAGYLKAEELPAEGVAEEEGPPLYRISIPNLEVRQIYRSTFEQWMTMRLDSSGARLRTMLEAMFRGDTRLFQRYLGMYTENMLSFHDGLKREPEALYQGLMLGLCGGMEPEHRVRSNRETGFGRADLLVIPARRGQPGAVLELKVAEEGWKTVEEAEAEGRAQLEEKNYVAELVASGASPIQKWVLVFDGKQVKVVHVGAERTA